jgi:hypothetical protein
LPGLSHGRWKYISSFTDIQRTDDSNGHNDKSPDDRIPQIIRVRFEQSALPNHHGNFELRVHHSDLYGEPMCRSAFRIIENPVSIYRKIIFYILLVAGAWIFQYFLNAKGTCTFLDPIANPTDVIDDLWVTLTKPLNLYWIEHPQHAETAQAISSLSLDGAILTLLYVGSTRRSSVRPFFSLFIFMTLRFIAQIMAVIPCAPGYVWPVGKIMGVRIPTIFVDDTHLANDMFFSGHSGSTLVIGLEFLELDYYKMGWWQLGVVFPLISTWVVSVRVHRGVDVMAAVLASIAACSISKYLSESVDGYLQVNKRVHDADRLKKKA